MRRRGGHAAALQIHVDGLEPPLVLEACTRARAGEFDRRCMKATSCRVTVAQGGPFRVSLLVHLPGHDIVVSGSRAGNRGHEDVHAALGDAFDVAERQQKHLPDGRQASAAGRPAAHRHGCRRRFPPGRRREAAHGGGQWVEVSMAEVPKRALITGGARRLGARMALAVAEDGFDVAIHCHGSQDEAGELVAAIEAMGRRAAIVVADLEREDEAARVVPEAAAALGPLGVLVNNASIFEMDHLATADRRCWDRHMEINLRSPLVLAQGFVRQLPPAAHGLIVNILDQRVMNLTPNFLSYSVSKVGLWAATQVLARQLAPRVRVNGIGPGPTLPSPHMSGERFAEFCRSMPLGHGSSPEEIANALRFIINSPSMTGQLLTIDAGQQLGWLTPAMLDLE